jgi:hypothetical protein
VNHHALLSFLAIKHDRGYDYVLLEERLYSAIYLCEGLLWKLLEIKDLVDLEYQSSLLLFLAAFGEELVSPDLEHAIQHVHIDGHQPSAIVFPILYGLEVFNDVKLGLNGLIERPQDGVHTLLVIFAQHFLREIFMD